jgi:hypothetical protein
MDMDQERGTANTMSRERLAEKVAFEGGPFEALQYGIRSADIADPELATLWHEMEQLYERIAPLARMIRRELSDAA